MLTLHRILFLALMIATCSSSSLAQTSFNTFQLGHTVSEMGLADGVVISHGIVYVAGGNGICLIDSATHRVLSYIGEGGWGYQFIAVVHPMLYFAGHNYVSGSKYLAGVIDVSDPTRPVARGVYDLLDIPMSISAAGTKAYVCAQSGRVRIIDFSDPDNPGEPGFYDSPGQPLRTEIDDTLAYVADGPGGLRIVNVKNAFLPVEVGSINNGAEFSFVQVSGKRLFTRESSMFGTQTKIYDLTDPAHPALVDSIAATGVSFEIRDTILVSNGDSLYFWSIPPSAAPYRLGSASQDGFSWGATSVSGTLAVSGRENVQFFDFSDPWNPRRTHTWYPTFRAEDVVRIGSYIVSADGRTLRVLDFTDPERPIEIGFWGENTNNILSVTGSDTVLYVAGGYSGLHVLSIADPHNPVELATFDTPDQAHGIATKGTFAYVADGASGLRVFDISNPRQPTPIGFVNTPGTALKVSVRDNIACVADGDSGLAIVDIGNPYSPQLRSYFRTPSTVWDVVQVDSYAYLAEYAFFSASVNLRILNIADPANPTEVVTDDSMSAAWRFHVVGNYLYAATINQGFEVLDISSRDHPRIVARYVAARGSGGYGVTTDGPYVYVARSPDGVFAVRNTLFAAPPIPTSPYLGATNIPPDVELRWQPVATATTYHVQMATSSTFGSVLVEDSTLTAVQFSHSGLTALTRYFWRVRANLPSEWSPWSTVMQFTTQVTTGVEDAALLPTAFALMQNYPNPFNPETVIGYHLASASEVNLRVYDLLGREVATLVEDAKPAGSFTVVWNASGVASGVYLYRLQAGQYVETKKLILLR